MPSTPADLLAFLDRLEVPYSTVSHPPLFTVEQSRELRGTIPGGHTKNLFLKASAAPTIWSWRAQMPQST